MTFRFFMLLTLACLITATEKCYKIQKDNFWPPWGGYINAKTSEVVSARVKLDPNTATYKIPEDQDSHRCQGSWNKLFGASRCASLHHIDSDRFVWRRSTKCWKFEGNKVVDIENCSEIGKLEIAAYAYDAGLKPFEHPGTLIRQFKTLVVTGQWYKYVVETQPTSTIYTLYNDSGKLLETQTITHRSCWFCNWGYYLGFYFGGACPAPQEVSACYDYL